MNRVRRRLLATGCVAMGATAAAGLPRLARARTPTAVDDPAAKRIALKNLHTGEELDVVFRRGDAPVEESLAAIQVLLRDFRNNEQHVIDPRLLDYLHDVACGLGALPIFSVISGYRSPQTNEQLREHSNGVARHSLHLEGRAIDVRLARVNCDQLAECARSLARGGVGYYRTSDFVHLDTGLYRSWKG
jgi:uncharacterized protein YcbK (DUF882 family)